MPLFKIYITIKVRTYFCTILGYLSIYPFYFTVYFHYHLVCLYPHPPIPQSLRFYPCLWVLSPVCSILPPSTSHPLAVILFSVCFYIIFAFDNNLSQSSILVSMFNIVDCLSPPFFPLYCVPFTAKHEKLKVSFAV